MGSPRFEGIHAQLDFKLSYGNKNQTQLTFVQNIVLKSKSEQNRNYEKYSQTGITVKIHTNHAGISATAIMRIALQKVCGVSPYSSFVLQSLHACLLQYRPQLRPLYLLNHLDWTKINNQVAFTISAFTQSILTSKSTSRGQKIDSCVDTKSYCSGTICHERSDILKSSYKQTLPQVCNQNALIIKGGEDKDRKQYCFIIIVLHHNE